MSSLPSPPLPEWVYKRDGRLVPFEADKISRALFAATESMGRPDAFAARELTDGILHFLASEAEGAMLKTAQVGELVVKVVRELGQPALALAFLGGRKKIPAKGSRIEEAEMVPAASLLPHSLVQPSQDPQSLVRRAGGACLRAFALRELFPRDLVAVHTDGLLTLGGLETPFELSGMLLGPPARLRLIETMEAARRIAGEFVAIDGPEYMLTHYDSREAVGDYVRELAIGARATGLQVVVNLNCAAAPFWAGDLADGPLFAESRQGISVENVSELADDLLERLLLPEAETGKVRVLWHLGERDFSGETRERTRLEYVARRALENENITFVFDRSRVPIDLAEGIDRRHPATLMTVALHLPKLADRTSSRSKTTDADSYLEKLGSLARMALSAGARKRDFLRRHDRNWPTFLLDRARLVVVPVGLEAVVRGFIGTGTGYEEESPELERRIVRRIAEVLANDGRACHLDACLDSGLSLVDVPSGSLRHSPILGTARLQLPEGAMLSAQEMVDELHRSWRNSNVSRLRFLRSGQESRQFTAPWEKRIGPVEKRD